MVTTYNPSIGRWLKIPTLAEWRRTSSTARFQFMDRRGSPEIRAIDQCVDAYSNLVLLPNSCAKCGRKRRSPDNVLYSEDSERWKYQIAFSETGLA
jgi:hypothetical protein